MSDNRNGNTTTQIVVFITVALGLCIGLKYCLDEHDSAGNHADEVQELAKQPIPTDHLGKIQFALRIVEASSRYNTGPAFGFKNFRMALKQPEFTGIVSELGAVVTFDNQGEPTQAHTTSAVEYPSGTARQVRFYTQQELKESAAQLKSYLSLMRGEGWDINTIIIFSEGFRMAACDFAFNKSDNIDYAVGREGPTLQVVRITPTGKRVVASEAIYGMPNEDPTDADKSKSSMNHEGSRFVASSSQNDLGALTRLKESALEALRSGEFVLALDGFMRLLDHLDKQGKPSLELGDCLVNIAGLLGQMAKHAESIQYAQRALAVYQSFQNTAPEQFMCRENLAASFSCMGLHKDAIKQHEQAIVQLNAITSSEEKWIRERAACNKKLGFSLGKLGRYEDACQRYENALGIYKTITDGDRDRANCHLGIGLMLNEIGQREEAIQQCKQSLEIHRSLTQSDRDQAGCYQNIGMILGCMKRHEENIQYQQRALAMYELIKNTEYERAGCYQNIGCSLSKMGRHQEAIRLHEQAFENLQLVRRVDRESQDARAGCQVNLGLALLSMGNYADAIKHYEQALEMFKAITNSERSQAGCLQSIGRALGCLGNYEEAIKHEECAIKTLKTVEGSEVMQGACWASIGECHLRAGQISEAIAAYTHSQIHGPDGGEGGWISRGLANAYRLRRQNGDDAAALDRYKWAVNVAESQRSLLLALQNRVAAFEEPSRAFSDFTAFLIELGGRKIELGLQSPSEWEGSVTPAARWLAFSIADRGKGRAMEDALREQTGLRSTRAEMKLLVENKDMSSRISRLTSLREASSDEEQRNRLTQSIDELQQRRDMVEVELKKATIGSYVFPECRTPMKMSKELPTDSAVLQYSIGEKEGWLLMLTRDGVTVHRVGAETTALPELLPRQQATFEQLIDAWKKRPDKIGLDGLVRLARERAEDQGREVKQNLLDATQEQAILQRLGNNVLPASALAELRQKKIHHLVVIPDSSLHYVPFAMLRVDGVMEQGSAGVLGRGSVGVLGQKHYLIEEFSVSYTPAMTTLETIRKQKKEREAKRKMERRQLLAFANPAYGSEGVPTLPAKMTGDDMVTRLRSVRNDYYKSGGLRLTSLPETEQEAMRVASLFAPPKQCSDPTVVDTDASALVLTSKAASEEQAKRLLSPVHLLPRYRYLLFSTHGLADTHNGMLSCVALSAPAADSTEDGFLQAQEVLDLELDTDLVMLSACQTGLGRLRGGEGLVGLSGAFFVAGAESISASLWNVPSGPTGQLVTEFFKHLKESKVDRAEALRQAQLTVMCSGQTADGKSTDYSSPFCWAAFVLVGEYK